MTDEQTIQEMIKEVESIHRGDTEGASKTLQKALGMLSVADHPQTYCRAKIAQAEIMRLQQDSECEIILKEVIEIASKYSFSHELASAHNVLGIIAYEQDNAAQAYQHLNIALELTRLNSTRKLQAIVLNSLGIMYAHAGEFERAMRYFLESLQQQKELDDDRGVGTAYSNIGALYLELGDLGLAVEFSERSLRYRLQSNDIMGAINTLLNLAASTENQVGKELALQYLQKAEMHARKNARGLLPNIYVRLAILYARKGETQTAQRYMKMVQDNKPSSVTTIQASELKLFAARALRLLGRNQEALELVRSHLTLSGSHMTPNLLEGMHRITAELLAENGELEGAQRHIQIADSYLTRNRNLTVIREVRNLGLRRQMIDAEITSNPGQERTRDSLAKRASLNDAVDSGESRSQQLQLIRERFELHRRSNARGVSLLGTIRTDINQIIGELDTEAQSLAKSTLQKIDEALRAAPNTLLSDAQLHEQFSLFVHGLRSMAPNLTPTELRVCLLVRMEFRSKEIAELLFCSNQTVAVHRKNLRRKLQLPALSNLTDFLNTLPI